MLTRDKRIRYKPKSGAKVLQIFELCKFFGNYFYKNFLKFSKTKSHFAHFLRFIKFINRKSCPKRKMLITWPFSILSNFRFEQKYKKMHFFLA